MGSSNSAVWNCGSSLRIGRFIAGLLNGEFHVARTALQEMPASNWPAWPRYPGVEAAMRSGVWLLVALPLLGQDRPGGTGVNFYSLGKEETLGAPVAAA